MRMFKPVVMAVLCCALSAPALADQASGWAAWEAKAGSILDAVNEPGHGGVKRQHVKDACRGVTGVVVGQGFQFPYWAQGLIPMCSEIDDIVGYNQEVDRRKWRLTCRSIKGYIGQLGKATPVAIAPTAHEKALALSAFMAAYYEQECAHGLERARR